MSTLAKLSIAVVAVLLVISGAWWRFSNNYKNNIAQQNTTNNNITPDNTTTTKDATVPELIINPEDSSNATIEKDLSLFNSHLLDIKKDYLEINQSAEEFIPVIMNDYSGESLATITRITDEEIKQKVATLNNLLAHVELLQIELGEKNTLKNKLQVLIDNLNLFREKIDNENSSQTANTSYKAMENAYNIYNLYVLETQMTIATSKIFSLVDFLAIVENKIQTKFSTITGNSVPALNQAFLEYKTKINDIKSDSLIVKNIAQDTKSDKNMLDSATGKLAISIKNLEGCQKILVNILATFKEMGE